MFKNQQLSLNPKSQFEKPTSCKSSQTPFGRSDLWIYSYSGKVDFFAGCSAGLVQDVDRVNLLLYLSAMEKDRPFN